MNKTLYKSGKESVGELFKEYPNEEFAEQLVKRKQISSKWKPLVPVLPIIPENNRVKDMLTPDLHKSRFLEFKDEFYENHYCKKVPLGKPTPAYSKPQHITNESVTFGKVSDKSEKVYDIVLPNKSPKQVLTEFVKWHDKYKISHGSYFPSEQINRGYSEKFNRNQIFGERKNADVTGKQVKNILQDAMNSCKLKIISKAQDEYIQNHKFLIGRPLRRQKYGLDADTIFGHPTRVDEFNVKKLLILDDGSDNNMETTYRKQKI